jgi:hypothetical protein
MSQTTQKNTMKEDNTTIIGKNGTDVEPEPPEKITKPFDPSLIRVKSKSMIIDTLLKRIQHEELELNPEFQRKAGLWTKEAQSQLIESLLIGVPLPAFYMDATNKNKWLVVDGLQRLFALKQFMIAKKLKLTGLEFLQELEEKSYDDMKRSLLRDIEETEIIVYLIEEGTPPEVKFNIFKRINTGGLPLSTQEIRHALYQGKATKLLAKLADSEEFKKATDNSISNERMEDREFVLRFLAFLLTDRSNLTKGLNHFLNETMVILNQKPEAELKKITKQFERAMWAAHQIFGNDAFRKRFRKQDRRKPINKALFDVFSVSLALYNDDLERIIQKRDRLIELFMELMRDSEFESTVSGGASDLKKVEDRFSAIKNIFEELLA